MARILWVEDEAEKLQGLVRPLVKSGDIVECAHDKSEALERLRKAKYDLLVIDLIIPDGRFVDGVVGMTNYEGVGLIRVIKKEIQVDSPIIVLSVVEDKSALEEIRDLGIDVILRKGSYLPSDLKREVDNILKR